MRIIFGLVLVIGVALAGFAVHMTRGYLSTYQAELDREKSMRANAIRTEEIFIATKQIGYGQPILPDMVKKVRWPVEAMPKDAFHSEEEIFPEGPETPRVALRSIEPMEPLMAVKVSDPGEAAGVASLLSKGMRAFAIRVDVTSGVSGLLRPGDRVDVYWSGRLPGSGVEVTKLIQPAMSLIAVDQTSDTERRSSFIARTVTVEATPTQVAALATARNSGRLSLALVGRNDDTVVSGVEVDKRAFLGIEEQTVAIVPKEEVCTVRTRKGGQIIDTPIPCTD
ncbi:Flp pilus assembly protein CpaB [Celeribacter neptunius]|uniref:Pilus assembly protein CpaB n=1 Tax=Celeribacter neptunius TaxID=588602 RepID=A0A1I3TPS0_9RHOB|nr:Flp pilus assembly protein CpaB [Celeribacter neptunius]SFJ72339.1 pilus assembly protein CpaB [Celeribacter neptunius]